MLSNALLWVCAPGLWKALNSLLRECDEMSLQHRRDHVMTKYLAKISSRRDHVTSSVLKAQKLFTVELNFPSKALPILTEALSRIGITWIIGKQTTNCPPWLLNQIKVDKFFFNQYRSTQYTLQPHTLTKYIRDIYSNRTKIYTDGSRSEDGHVGVAVVIPEHDYSMAYRISDHISIDTAEFEAI